MCYGRVSNKALKIRLVTTNYSTKNNENYKIRKNKVFYKGDVYKIL